MSSKKPAAWIALAALFLVPALASWGQSPTDLLTKADRVRDAWPEAVLTLKVTVTKPGAPPASGSFEVLVKGRTRSLIRFLDPKDDGKLFLAVDEDAWLLLPGTKNPIKVPKAQRLRGGFGAADVSKTRFAEDYDAVVERQDTLDGRECDVLRLIAKKGHSPSYPVVRVWVDRKESLYRKAIFLLPSGKTAKESTFDSYKVYAGTLSLEKMTIVDAIQAGTTVVEYVGYEKKALSDALFDAKTAREAASAFK